MRPTLQYGSEVSEGNKTQAATLESGGAASVFLGAPQRLVIRQLEGIWAWIPFEGS